MRSLQTKLYPYRKRIPGRECKRTSPPGGGGWACSIERLLVLLVILFRHKLLDAVLVLVLLEPSLSRLGKLGPVHRWLPAVLFIKVQTEEQIKRHQIKVDVGCARFGRRPV